MTIKDILEIKEVHRYNQSELMNICINSEHAYDSLIEGVSSIGTLLFEASCNENDPISNQTIGEIGLLINQVALIASALKYNIDLADKELNKNQIQIRK